MIEEIAESLDEFLEEHLQKIYSNWVFDDNSYCILARFYDQNFVYKLDRDGELQVIPIDDACDNIDKDKIMEFSLADPSFSLIDLLKVRF